MVGRGLKGLTQLQAKLIAWGVLLRIPWLIQFQVAHTCAALNYAHKPRR